MTNQDEARVLAAFSAFQRAKADEDAAEADKLRAEKELHDADRRWQKARTTVNDTWRDLLDLASSKQLAGA